MSSSVSCSILRAKVLKIHDSRNQRCLALNKSRDKLRSFSKISENIKQLLSEMCSSSNNLLTELCSSANGHDLRSPKQKVTELCSLANGHELWSPKQKVTELCSLANGHELWSPKQKVTELCSMANGYELWREKRHSSVSLLFKSVVYIMYRPMFNYWPNLRLLYNIIYRPKLVV